MKVDYPGLIEETLPSGSKRYRVRVKGDRTKRIRIYAQPGHPEFETQYYAARVGDQPSPLKEASDYARSGSIAWLKAKYLEHLEKRVTAGLSSHKTLKKKRNLLSRFTPETDRIAIIPTPKLIEMRDKMMATPSQADAFIEAVSVMYDWGIKAGHISTNTAKGIDRIYVKGGGADPWSASDVKAYFKRHRIGTKAHVCLSILLWTGCRIEDTLVLGRQHECIIKGVEAIRWKPLKKNSTEVAIPLMPMLKESVRAPTVQGMTYLVGRGGKPYASGDSASSTFKQWCRQAGLGHLSAHGVRKALAELLVELGCTEYEIMAILGHSESRTTQIYTRGAERWRLAKTAMEKVKVSHAWF